MILWQEIARIELETGVSVVDMSLDDFIGLLYDYGYISNSSK